MDVNEAVESARTRFLDDRHEYGCAETTFLVLRDAFGLLDIVDASPAMAFNGGVAYSGGICGVISGVAIAVGLLAERRLLDHRAAKRVARGIVARFIDDFRTEFGAVDCRVLIGRDLSAPGEHEAFIASGVWRETCLSQIEFAVRRMVPYGSDGAWRRAVGDYGTPT